MRFWPGRTLRIFNLNVTESIGSAAEERQLRGRDELSAEIVRQFDMPEDIVSDAISSLGEFGDAWT